MEDQVLHNRFEYRFFAGLDQLDRFLRDHLDHTLLVLACTALALAVWWMMRRRPTVGNGSGRVDLPLTGIFDFTRSPRPSHLRDEPPP